MAMNCQYYSLVALFLSLVMAVSDIRTCAAAISLNDEGTIEEICRHGTDRELCISSLKSDPRSFEANYRGLARISIELALKNATDSYSYIQQLKIRSTDPVVKSTLQSCEDYYLTGMILDIPEALKEFDQQLYNGAAGALSTCEACADDCEREFSEQPPGKSRPSPLTHRNYLTGMLCAIASSLTQMIAKS